VAKINKLVPRHLVAASSSHGLRSRSAAREQPSICW
jgi:hypothetical protein